MSKIAGSQPRISTLRFVAVILGATNTVLADTAMANGTETEIESFAAQPDFPRNLTVTGNDANVSGNVIIEGTNGVGAPITETIALNGTATVVGNKAFATVALITLPAYDTASTERVRVGVGSKLGLPVALNRNSVIAAFRNGVRETTAPTVAVSASAVEDNTVTLNSALNGTDVIVDFYETI